MALDEATQNELSDLIAAMRDAGLDAPRAERLADLLRASREARVEYLRRVDQCASIRRYSADLSFTRDPSEHEPTSMLTEALMRQRLGVADDLSGVAEAIVTEPHDMAVAVPPWRARRRVWVAAAILATVALPAVWLTAAALMRSSDYGDSGAVASVTALKNVTWVDEAEGALSIGQQLTARKLRLGGGEAVLTFASGAVVTLHGPGELALDTAMAARLAHGRLDAHVPAEATGFTIAGPGFAVIDIGTEFTIDVPRRGRAWVHVTRGAVDLALTNRDGSVRRSMRLTDDLSAVVDTAGRRVVVSEPMPIEVHDTGAGLKVGDADPYWQITAVSDESDFEEAPAYAVTLDPRWAQRGEADRARWVSRHLDNKPVHGSSVHTFATAFDLTGMDPSTARMVLRFVADNRVDAIRLNGLSVDVPAHRDQPPFSAFTEVTMDHGFVPGLNTLELDVRNIWPRDDLSPMGLLAEVRGTVHRVVEWTGRIEAEGAP